MASVDAFVAFYAVYFTLVCVHLGLRRYYLRRMATRLRSVERQQVICVVSHSFWIALATIVIILACFGLSDAMVRFDGGLVFCQDFERASYDCFTQGNALIWL
jgi:uncharacterized membrane protein